MTILASSILDRARSQLIDATAVRWSDDELLRFLSDGCRTLVSMAPAASADRAIIELVEGTLQSIPTDGHMLLKIERNNNAAGTAPGRTVTLVPSEILDAYNPDWHTGSEDSVVRQCVYDPTREKKFYVYPPNDGTGYLEVVYSVLPPELTDPTDELVVQDIYQTALFDYVMFRAHQKDDDYAAGAGVAQGYLNAFIAAVGAGEQGQLVANPNGALASTDLSQRSTAK